MPTNWNHCTVWLILLVYVALAGMYSIVNPLFEAPDEVWHYEYVRWLVEGNGLPQPEEVGEAPWRQEGSQPPLYYTLVAALTAAVPTDNAAAAIRYNPHAAVGQAEVYGNKNVLVHGEVEAWPWRGVVLAAHLGRFFSILLGAITVLFTYQIAQTLFPERPILPLLAALLVALNPQFLFLSAAVNNDNLVTAICTVGLWLLVTMVAQTTTPHTAGEWRRWLVIGLVVGLAALSKLSGLMLGVFAGGVLLWRAWQLRAWGELIRGGLALTLVAGSVAGWWYLRNWWFYDDPLGLPAMFEVLPGRAEPLTMVEILSHAQGVWRSLWAVFGWFNVVADPWLYQVYTGLSLMGVLGLLLGVGMQRWRRLRAGNGAGANPYKIGQIGLLLLWIVVFVLLVMRWTQISYPQGRLLFPALSAAATLLAWGLTLWLPTRWHGGLVVVLALLLLPLALLAPWRWIAPAYAAPDFVAAGAMLPNATAINFGEGVQLAGFQWSADEVQPGARLTVDLYWRALQPLATDYSVFVHLTDDNEILQVQRDSYPAAGARATSDWPPNSVILDRHSLMIPAVLPTPTRLRIDVGLYDYRTGQRLRVNGADDWTLGYVKVTPAAEAAQPTVINFGDELALTNYAFDRWLLHAGEEFAVTLDWEALALPRKDYVVFVHLILPPEAVWAQRDDRPQGGEGRTSTWQRGQRVQDRFVIELPAEMPPGLYRVEIGLYDPETGERLKVGLSDAGVLLGQVRVVAK